MHINSILLRLLGTFYKHSKDSFAISGIDKIYSQLMFDKYVFIARREIMSSSGVIPSVPFLGYIKATDIDIPTKKIKILTPKGEEVNLDGENILSFMYLDSSEFFSCNDNVLSDDGYKKLQNIWGDSDILPVIYHKNMKMKMGTTASFIESEDDVSYEILKMLSSMAVFNSSSIGAIEDIINIIIGAEYYTGNGIVSEVSGGGILIDDVEYNVDEEYISVSEGDILSGVTLLEKPVSVSFAGESGSVELDRINTVISSSASSEALKSYLRIVGAKVSKTLIVANIPLAVISETDSSILKSLSNIVSHVSSYIYKAESKDTSSNEEMLVSSDSTLIFEGYGHLFAHEESIIMLDLASDDTVGLNEDYELEIPSEENIVVDDSESSFLPYEMKDTSTITYNTDSIKKIIELEDMMMDDEDSVSFAMKTTHIFVDAKEDYELKPIAEEDITLGDMVTDGIFKDGIFSNDEQMSVLDKIVVSNNTDDLEEFILNSAINVTEKSTDTILMYDAVSGRTSIETSSYMGITIGDDAKIVTHEDIEEKVEFVVYDLDLNNIDLSSSDASQASYATESSIGATDSIKTVIVNTNAFSIDDEMSVISDSDIDE